MKLVPTKVDGVHVLEGAPASDERGSFARLWDAALLASAGLTNGVAEASVSRNHRAGTIRGMHWQRASHAEAKAVLCTRGAIFDVVADVRRDSPTFGRWEAFELTADDTRLVYIPEGVAHGFQTLQHDSALVYLISTPYDPSSAAGCRYDDPLFDIDWPAPPTVIAPRDLAWEPLQARP